jgi:hypothetical protein
VTVGERHPESVFDLLDQLRGTQAIVFLLAGIQPLPQCRMGLASMPMPSVNQGFPGTPTWNGQARGGNPTATEHNTFDGEGQKPARRQ